MAWEIPRPYHDNLSPFSTSEDGLIHLHIELTPDELNTWLTLLVSATLIRDEAQPIFPLWNAQPIETSPTLQDEDTYRDIFSDFDPVPTSNVTDGKLTMRGAELNTGDSILFVTQGRVITIPLRGLSGGEVSITVDGQHVEDIQVAENETVEVVLDTEKSAATVEIEVIA